MWNAIQKHFSDYPAQEKVARLMLQYGLRVGSDSKVYCEDIEVPALRIARSIGLDRRAVNATVDTILKTVELRRVYSELHPFASLKDVAPLMGWGVVEIIPTNAAKHGILAGVARVIANAKINIRQALSDDPEFTEKPHLYVICERDIPARLIPKLKEVPGVKSVILS